MNGLRHKLYKILYPVLLPGVALANWILLMYFQRKYASVIVWDAPVERIGHLAANTEVFLRRKSVSKEWNKSLHVLFCSRPDAANKFLVDMIKRHILVIESPAVRFVIRLLALYNPRFWCVENSFPFESNEYYELNELPSQMAFTSQEESDGQKLLIHLGLKADDYFVTVHTRDKAYLKKRFPAVNWSYHGYRNSNIKNFIPAMNYLNGNNIWCIRIGEIVESGINSRSEKIVEFGNSPLRSEFGDVYLAAKCKFFLCDPSGPYSIPVIFGTPSVVANLIPLYKPSLLSKDIFIPKKLWLKEHKRFLTFREMIASGIYTWADNKLYLQAGLEIVENSADEILAVTKEMNERIDGVWIQTEEDEEMQRRFRALFPPESFCFGFPSRIGANFLRENCPLLE